MSKNIVEKPRQASGEGTGSDERAALLAWFEGYEPRTELGRKLVARRVAALKAGQEVLDHEGIMREVETRRGGRSYVEDSYDAGRR